MKIVVARSVLGPSADSSWFTMAEYNALWSTDVADDDETTILSTAIEAALRENSEPYQMWWTRHVTETESGSMCVVPDLPAPGYGLDSVGRLLIDEGYKRLTVAQYVRALDEGYYGSKRREIVLVPPPEVGGHGHIGQTIIEWFLDNAPSVLIGYVGGKMGDFSLNANDRRLRRLAADWAAQRIESPYQLRKWIDKKGEWFPEIVSRRLSLSEAAGHQLLLALGYERNDLGLMQRRNSIESLGRRHVWLSSEHGTFMEQFDEGGWEAGLLDPGDVD